MLNFGLLGYFVKKSAFYSFSTAQPLLSSLLHFIRQISILRSFLIWLQLYRPSHVLESPIRGAKLPLLVSSIARASLVSGDHTVHVLSFIITFGKCTAFQVAFSFWDSVSRYAILVRHGPGTTFLGFLAFLG